VESEPILSTTLKQAATDAISIPGQSQRLSAPVRFGNEFDLLGYEVLNRASKGGTLRVVTIWRVVRDAPMDSSIFVHLLDADGAIVGQHDAFDVWTPALKSDDIVAQLHTIEIQPDVSAGFYRLQAGIYTRAEKERLPVQVNGKTVADRVWLKVAEVTQ